MFDDLENSGPPEMKLENLLTFKIFSNKLIYIIFPTNTIFIKIIDKEHVINTENLLENTEIRSFHKIYIWRCHFKTFLMYSK